MRKPEPQDAPGIAPEPPPAAERPRWCEPKLTFVEPTLANEGPMTELTADGIFGTFIP